MFLDLVLATLHHFLAFGIVALVLAEGILLRPGMPPDEIDRLSRLDRGYGIAAALLVVVGILRLIFGAKGTAYYLQNPWFWAKMVSFAAAGVLSIQPTMRILGWRRSRQASADFMPPVSEIESVQKMMRAERVVLFLVIVFAATMARYT